MQCVHPFWLRKEYMFVPCGSCLGCRIAHSREWSLRLLHELGYWDHAVFLTLTYDEEHCPLSLSKRELQLFWKRLRKELAPRKIKYFACGEYGDTYGRPHYHAIVFGLQGTDEKVVQECWNNGFVMLGGVSQKSIGYVTGYVLKKYGKDKNKEMYEQYGRQAPFQLVSAGLGLRYALDNSDLLSDNLECKYNGRSVGVPRYYVKKLGLDTDIIKVKGLESKYVSACAFYDRVGLKPLHYPWMKSHGHVVSQFESDCLDFSSAGVAWRSVLKQKEMNYEAKDRMKKGIF